MTDLAVIVPSRGRPQNIARLIQAWKDTEAEATLMVCIDNNDPKRDEYEQVFLDADHEGSLKWYDTPNRLVPWLNRCSTKVAGDYFALGFCGDDHVPRTKHFDKRIVDKLRAIETGVAYGNDGVWGQELSTSWFMTSDIVQTLGYMIPPVLTHMYADNAAMDYGRATNLVYLSDVLIEHMHPIVSKALPDAQYDEVGAFMEPDKIAYEQYKADGSFERDVEKLKALIGEK